MAIDRRSFISRILALVGASGLMRPASASRKPSAASSRHFEFAIIGAGLLGSAAARHLSQQSDSVALIGPAEPANVSSHQGIFASHYDASRLVRGVDPDLTWATLAVRSIERYRDIEEAAALRFYNEIGYMMVTPGGLGED
ncbi:MAG: FAD-dependent oxidoreductase, partial [Woeseiaceae bacterium]|nr:FAD-dependent oxidoreductase [Woeseiaceae bacterium]